MLRPTLRPAALTAAMLVLGLAAPAPAAAQDPGSRPRMLFPDSVAIGMTQRYPEEYERMGAGGLVRLRAFIDTAGAPENIQVVSSTGFPRLDAAAASVLRGTRFAPAQGSDGPRGTWIDLRLQFGASAAGGVGEAIPAVVGREEMTVAAQALYPASLRGPSFAVSVPFLLTVAPDGRVTAASSPDPGCFPDATNAAQRIVRGLRFEPSASTDEVRRTAATVTFRDSVTIRLRGDDLTRPIRAAPTADSEPVERRTTRRPQLTNQREVQAALVRNYPPTLRDAGMGGTVVIWFFVDEHGRVARLQLSRTSGICELDVAGMNIASIMRFSPAEVNDAPVAVWVEIPIVFTAR